MLYREIIAVCSPIHTKHTNTLCGQNSEYKDCYYNIYYIHSAFEFCVSSWRCILLLSKSAVLSGMQEAGLPSTGIISISTVSYYSPYLRRQNSLFLSTDTVCAKSGGWLHTRVIREKLVVAYLVKKLPVLYATRSSLPCSQQPPAFPVLRHTDPVHSLPCYLFNYVLILSSHPRLLCLPCELFPSAFSTKIVCGVLFPYMPHTLPILFSLVWSPDRCLVQVTKHEASHYAVFSSLLPLLTSLPQHLFSNTLSLCSFLIVRDQVSHPCKTEGSIILVVLYI